MMIQKGNQTVDAASILDLLSLGLAGSSSLDGKRPPGQEVTEALGRLFGGIRGGTTRTNRRVVTD